MSNLTKMDDYRGTFPASRRGKDKGPGGPGDGGDMEERLRHLEQDMAVVRSNYATKADISGLRSEMHDLGRQIIMWNVGTIIATAALVFAIIQYAG